MKENKMKMKNIFPRTFCLRFQGLRVGFELGFGLGLGLELVWVRFGSELTKKETKIFGEHLLV